MGFIFSIFMTLLITLFQTGCASVGSRFTQAASPDFWAVETQAQNQQKQIQAAVQANQIPFTLGDGLSANDEIIRRLSRQFQSQSNNATDLTSNQYALLTQLLKDNHHFMANAFTHPDDWQDSFADQDTYIQSHRESIQQDFGSSIQRARFIVYLNMRLKEDQSKTTALIQSGQLSPDQADRLRSNLTNVQNKAVEDYYANGRFDLTEDQIFQLRRMLADSYQSLQVPPSTAYGGTDSPDYSNPVPSDSWASNPPPVASNNQFYSGPSAPAYNSSAPIQSASAPTPTPTPLSHDSGTLEGNRVNNYNPIPKNSGDLSIAPAPLTPTATLPPVPTPTASPTPTREKFHHSAANPNSLPPDHSNPNTRLKNGSRPHSREDNHSHAPSPQPTSTSTPDDTTPTPAA
ncbi:MAG: hypothetical protein ACREL1_09315 [bacterium]